MQRLNTAIGRSSRLISVAVVVFSVSVLGGVVLEDMASSLSVSSGVQDSPLTLSGLPSVVTILQHNLVTGVLLVGGVVTMGATTMANLVFNGVLLGLTIGRSLAVTDPMTVALLLVPHGVFELTAFMLAAAAGFRGPQAFVQYLRGKKEYLFTREDLMDVVMLGALSVALIVIAAVVERYVTLELARSMW